MFNNDYVDLVSELINDNEKKKERIDLQDEFLPGLYIATVVDTLDPLKQGRVRFFTSFLDDETTKKEGLPWASPISSFGGFDDSGCVWIPPAGSKIAIMFLNGVRDSAFYLGTIWNRNRGPSHFDYWGYNVNEYNCLWGGPNGLGRDKGYLIGDPDQVFPPWNTEMYNGYDVDSINNFYNDTNEINSTTNPYIKGMKTEEKHMLKFVEGDPRCNRRWKRVELASGRGNWIMMKDDHLHAAGQWAFGDGAQFCHTPPDEIGETMPDEDPCCDCDPANITPCYRPDGSQGCAILRPPKNNQPGAAVDSLGRPYFMPPGCMPQECPTACSSSSSSGQPFQNPYFKRCEEMRPYQGANNPQANKCELDQSGIQMQSIGGHQVVLDDSVNQPTGVPTWDRDFDFGCDDTCRMRMWMQSATGHRIEMNDYEDIGSPRIRGECNGINMRTASGNFLELNDSTVGAYCEPEYADDRRGITMCTSSTHLFQMNDSRLKQYSPIRANGGAPEKASEHGFEGYILLRSGYGLQLLMSDDDIQTETDQQFIQLLAPQISNTERGQHMFVMQEAKSGPGLVMLRTGGVYYQSSYDQTIEVTGDENNPASRFTTVTDDWSIDVENLYFNHNGLTIYYSDSYIFLMAGNDCPTDFNQVVQQSQTSQSQSISKAQSNPGQSDCSGNPCLYNVIVSKDPWVCPFTNYVHYGIGGGGDSRSQRVYASAGLPSEPPPTCGSGGD